MKDIKIEVSGLNNIDKMLNLVSNVSNMLTSFEFNQYIKEKVEQTYIDVINRNLIPGLTTNDEEIEIYKDRSNWGTYDITYDDGSTGFILYNKASIPADKYNILPFDKSGYPNGEFSIALAFEYGTGMVDTSVISKSKQRPKAIKLTNNSKSWYLPKNVKGESGVVSFGYEAYEIFRKTRIEVEQNLDNWVEEYLEKVM